MTPQALIIVAIGLTAVFIILYRRLLRSIKVISRGMDLLREQDFSSRLNKVGQADADRIVEMFNHMIDCLKEQKLRIIEQNELLGLLIDASPLGVLILDDSDHITRSNAAARQMLGIGDSCRLRELTSPLALALGQLDRGEVRTVRLGDSEIYRCSRLHFMDRGWPHPFVLIERLTDEVRAAEKQAFTRAIRTMAHEVNNSMAAILSTLSTVRGAMAETSSAARLLRAVDACADRSEELTRFVRRFAEVAKVPEPRLCLTDFMELTLSVLPILEQLCADRGVKLQTDLEGAAPVRLDPVLMQQALVNIVKNAAESASAGGGNVIIRAEGTTLRIIDNGPGLSPDAAGMLFSTPYSTKPGGQGLGLLLVAEILARHSARYSLLTDGPHTTFTLTL